MLKVFALVIGFALAAALAYFGTSSLATRQLLPINLASLPTPKIVVLFPISGQKVPSTFAVSVRTKASVTSVPIQVEDSQQNIIYQSTLATSPHSISLARLVSPGDRITLLVGPSPDTLTLPLTIK